MAYTTLANVKTKLNITGTAQDAVLTLLIGRVDEAINLWTHRVFEASADTIRYLSPTTDVIAQTLYLDRDLCAITGITNGDDTVLAGTDYRTWPFNYQVDKLPIYAIQMLPASGKAWNSGGNDGMIAIEGRWAYSITPPGPIITAAEQLVTYWYNVGVNSGMSEITSSGTGTVKFVAEAPVEMRSVLDYYVRRSPKAV